MSAHFDSSHYASTHYESSHYNRGLVAVITPGGGLDEDTLWRIRRLKKRQRNVANAVALLTMLVSVIDEETDYNAEEPDE
jgi:Na+/alanine symporter